jgi:hypothetical protein
LATEALHLSSVEASSGTTTTIALPSGPVVVRIPPVRSGGFLKIQTAQGSKYLRVRVIRSPGRRLVRAVGAFLVFIMFAMGPVFLIAGVIAPPPNPNSAPLCGAQQMDPSDVCQITDDNGSTTTYNYAQMQQMQPGPGALIAVGGMLTAADAVDVLVVVLKRRARRKKPVLVRALPA